MVKPTNQIKSVPIGVKIIAILNYIGAGFAFLFGILFILGGGAMASAIPLLGLLGAGFFIAAGVILLGLGILSLFIGLGLWKLKKWARIVAIIFAVLGVIGAIAGMIGGSIVSLIPSLVIEGVIGGYLWFHPEVKEAFS